MNEARCIHDMVDGTCGICLQADIGRAAAPERAGGFRRSGDKTEILARFEGYCQAGHDRIFVGDTIVYSDEHEAFVHPDCT